MTTSNKLEWVITIGLGLAGGHLLHHHQENHHGTVESRMPPPHPIVRQEPVRDYFPKDSMRINYFRY